MFFLSKFGKLKQKFSSPEAQEQQAGEQFED